MRLAFTTFNPNSFGISASEFKNKMKFDFAN